MQAYPTLYKKSGKKIQQWDILADNRADGTAFTQVTHGQTDGKKQSTIVNYVKGKNIGKSNETTPFEQACAEALSKWKKQQDGGYTLDKDGKAEQVLPMLAHSYDDYKHQVGFPSWVQVKMDGQRIVTVIKNGVAQMYSRKGKEVITAPHIIDFLSSKPDCILDGELYSHELDFQEFISIAKKFDPINHTKLHYVIYDVIDDGTFEERFINREIPSNDFVYKLDTFKVNSHNEIMSCHDKFVQDGYEGAIVRHGDCFYQKNKRSRQLLKVKKFTTEEFEIVGAKENQGKLENTCTFVLKTAQGAEFEAMPDGDQEHREKLWQESAKLTGKMATIKFFEWTDSEPPVPRFPIFIGVRDYE